MSLIATLHSLARLAILSGKPSFVGAKALTGAHLLTYTVIPPLIYPSVLSLLPSLSTVVALTW